VADLADPHEVMDLAKRVLGEVGNVSFLVNVAGGPVAPSHEDQLPTLPTRAFPIEEIDDVDWTRILATNLTTAFLVCRAFVPALKVQRAGRIVNFTSIAARRGSDRVGAHYAAAKGGVIGLTKTLALELGPHGITVNAIAPGFINTERIEATAWGHQAPGQHRALLDAIPLGRLGRPDDIPGVVALLCSDAGGYVSGATIDVNGGLYFGP
jgi:NAD(P)-dependent dehydrogenase (short-subunit alcohol dehydrogenase family)